MAGGVLPKVRFVLRQAVSVAGRPGKVFKQLREIVPVGGDRIGRGPLLYSKVVEECPYTGLHLTTTYKRSSVFYHNRAPTHCLSPLVMFP